MTLKELFGVKHPLTWGRFERGEIDENELFEYFFKDGRQFDGQGMKEAMVSCGLFLCVEHAHACKKHVRFHFHITCCILQLLNDSIYCCRPAI